MRKLWLLPLVVLVIFLGTLGGATPALGEVEVVSSNALVAFPLSITFGLQARAPTDIVDIDLKYRVHKLTLLPTTWRVDVDFTPGQSVEASWTWDMLETGGLPTGTRLEYWWLIEDASGKKTETTPSVIEYEDTRFEWNSLNSGQITLYWYEGILSFAQQLLDAADEALRQLSGDSPAALARPAKIYIYASFADLRSALINPQEWTGGVTFSDHGTIVIGISPDNPSWGERTIAHEFSHLVVHLSVYGPFGAIPVWLDEGLAVYAEGELRSDMRSHLEQAIARNQLISARSLSSGLPTDPDEALLSYAESYSVVKFLIEEYGKEKVLDLLSAFKSGASFDEALNLVYGFDTDGLDARWRASLGLNLKVSVQINDLAEALAAS